MDTARYKDKITIHSMSITGDSHIIGEVWRDYKTFMGTVVAQKGSTAFKDGNTYVDSITIHARRFFLDGEKGYRVRFNSKNYEIKNWTPVDRYSMVIDAQAVV